MLNKLLGRPNHDLKFIGATNVFDTHALPLLYKLLGRPRPPGRPASDAHAIAYTRQKGFQLCTLFSVRVYGLLMTIVTKKFSAVYAAIFNTGHHYNQVGRVFLLLKWCQNTRMIVMQLNPLTF